MMCENEILFGVYDAVPLALKLVSDFAVGPCVVGDQESEIYTVALLRPPLSRLEGRCEYGSSGRLVEQAGRKLADRRIAFEGAMETACGGAH
jgi:hypothetical protein